jgi:hypothetical protein
VRSVHRERERSRARLRALGAHVPDPLSFAGRPARSSLCDRRDAHAAAPAEGCAAAVPTPPLDHLDDR